MKTYTLYYLTSVLLLITIGVNGDFTHINCAGNGIISGTMEGQTKSVVAFCDGSFQFPVVDNDTTININGCPLNVPVQLYMLGQVVDKAKWTASMVSQGFDSTKSVQCNGHNLSVTWNVTNTPSSTPTAVSVPYTEQLQMNLYAADAPNTAIKNNVQVGKHYNLKISSVGEVFIHVLSCKAAPESTSNKMVDIYSAGLQSRANVNSNTVLGIFDETTKKSASALLTGFRFVVSDNVFIKCTVDVCSKTGCPSLTPSTLAPTVSSPDVKGKRRRRNVLQQKHKKTVTISTSFRVESLSTNGVQGMVANECRYIFIASILLMKFSLRRF